MSHKNKHMGLKPTGIRGGIAKFTTNGTPKVVKIQELYKNLHEQMVHINTWEDFDRGCIAEDLYGNTKHTDLKIIPHFFNEGLGLTTAGIAIGYAQRLFNGHGNRLPPTILMFRLRRMNIANLFAIIQVFIDKGLIDIETIREILRIEGHFTQKHASRRRGKFYRYYAKWYVTDAIKYFTDDALEKQMLITNIVILNITAEHIGVSVKTLKYWHNLEVEDIMVKPS